MASKIENEWKIKYIYLYIIEKIDIQIFLDLLLK